MNAPKFWMVVPALLVAGAVSMVYAKLPQPPMDDAAKAAAEAKKAKAAEQAKKDSENLAKAQDHAVANYKKEHGGKTVAVSKKK
jgi:membrane protein involved in colicin uptake